MASDLFGRGVQATVVTPERVGAVTARRRRPTAGTFSRRGFPYVHALVEEGRRGPAAYAVDEMPAYTNHVGPVAEKIGPVGERPGSEPRAFTPPA
ncbi:hypothetical protein O3Q52_41345 [Streptomyces sp. ActVer]|uniref:hypothetical protein n=1 Tax=Streptomyces sp. ActVer TaxID=3014558 RepID=UPI0022B58F85|nr:hypothetical protein [Streptomyces sp. ActVer]MCZ4514470.1 hypothetical protein [Streptomyces sp. ActVer]